MTGMVDLDLDRDLDLGVDHQRQQSGCVGAQIATLLVLRQLAFVSEVRFLTQRPYCDCS